MMCCSRNRGEKLYNSGTVILKNYSNNNFCAHLDCSPRGHLSIMMGSEQEPHVVCVFTGDS